ncbi:TOBE domain-containing protein [Peterkaempfera sp. SMS 1(5)a]|uniref:TOBE domain-containing protein n=1 Tax=Peterkaempfera podocarpi TaxID=3232308 RepID=UPI00367143FB
MCTSDDDAGELQPGQSLTGTVTDTAYRGRGYDHVVELPDGTPLTGVFDKQPHPRGTPVRVTLDPDGCFAYPAAPPQADAAASFPLNRPFVEIS